MTNWNYNSKAIQEHNLSREQSDILLRENGGYILTENSKPDWSNQTKNTTTWSNRGINVSDFNFLIDDTYSFLIDDNYQLIIGQGQNDWSYRNKN